MNILEWIVAKMKRPDETDKAMSAHEEALRRVQKLEREKAEFESMEKRQR